MQMKGRMFMRLNNWMENIGDEKSLKDINIPGTHDSTTKFCQFSLFSSCQKLSVAEQLKIGVRAFDIRVEGMTLVHSFCKCKKGVFQSDLTLCDVVGDILSFLSENPTETVLMFFKMDKGDDSGKCLDLLFENFITPNPDKWYLENEITTLGEVRGKIVLIRRTDTNHEKSGVDFTAMPYQGGVKETKWEDFSPNGADKVTVQDRYSLPAKKKWEMSVKPLLEKCGEFENNLVINFLSDAGFPFIPRLNARYINKQFLKFPLVKQNHYGLIMLDFANEKITEKIIKTN